MNDFRNGGFFTFAKWKFLLLILHWFKKIMKEKEKHTEQVFNGQRVLVDIQTEYGFFETVVTYKLTL